MKILNPLIGYKPEVAMKLVAIEYDEFERVNQINADEYQIVFDAGLGRFPGEVHLETDSTIKPLKRHDVPDRPWQKFGIDIFLLKDRRYLVAVDYLNQFKGRFLTKYCLLYSNKQIKTPFYKV
ncbi:hypothetical protein NPIL_176541 [Nephila pilipes]|uniref:Uncharacterized protein n=1 Tax=Nephila pilipes TaxID=299642 RepID=A0A8X6NYI3_NEPPI|nr:hypothetical protein NPIL_176541 [Nephila pilipes]